MAACMNAEDISEIRGVARFIAATYEVKQRFPTQLRYGRISYEKLCESGVSAWLRQLESFNSAGLGGRHNQFLPP